MGRNILPSVQDNITELHSNLNLHSYVKSSTSHNLSVSEKQLVTLQFLPNLLSLPYKKFIYTSSIKDPTCPTFITLEHELLRENHN